MDHDRDRPPILTERRFDRRLAALVLLAFVAHLLILAASVLFGEFRLRPQADIEAYTVEMIDGGELGGHMPSGLPALDIGPAAGKKAAPAKAAAKAIEKPLPPPPPAPPEAKPAPPPEPPQPEPAEAPKPEPPAPPPPDEPKPEVVAKADEPVQEEGALVVPATPTPTPRPTATPVPKVATPRPPTATPVKPTPTRKPAATPTRVAAKPSPKPSPRPSATGGVKPAATRTAAAPRASATPAGARGTPGPKASATPIPRDAKIADALARVQQRVEESRRADGEAGAPQERGAQERAASGGAAAGAAAGGARSGGGVGGTDTPDPRRGIGIGPGAGGAGKVRGLEFLLYYNAMIARIRNAWAWPGDKPTLVVKVRFSILDDGAIGDLRVVEPSGDGSYDASVLRAVRAASPLGPPPAAYRKDFADVELIFQPSDLQVQP